MKIRFWGTRGSIASPSWETRELGGNTTCVQVMYGDNEDKSITLDCGTGVIQYATQGVDLSQSREFHFLVSHFHWDSILGFPFFHPIHAPGTVVHFYSPFPEEECRANISLLFDGTYSPLRDINNLASDIHFHCLPPEGGQVNGLTVTMEQTTHSDVCYAYRLEGDGVSLGYVSDHERMAHEATNQRIVELLQGVEVLIHEAHFTDTEYLHRRHFGHGRIEDAIANAHSTQAKHLLLFHHAPEHSDDFLRLYLRRVLRKADPFVEEGPETIRLASEREIYEF